MAAERPHGGDGVGAEKGTRVKVQGRAAQLAAIAALSVACTRAGVTSCTTPREATVRCRTRASPGNGKAARRSSTSSRSPLKARCCESCPPRHRRHQGPHRSSGRQHAASHGVPARLAPVAGHSLAGRRSPLRQAEDSQPGQGASELNLTGLCRDPREPRRNQCQRARTAAISSMDNSLRATDMTNSYAGSSGASRSTSLRP